MRNLYRLREKIKWNLKHTQRNKNENTMGGCGEINKLPQISTYRKYETSSNT